MMFLYFSLRMKVINLFMENLYIGKCVKGCVMESAWNIYIYFDNVGMSIFCLHSLRVEKDERSYVEDYNRRASPLSQVYFNQ